MQAADEEKTEEEDPLESEEAGAKMRTKESAEAGVQLTRPPRGMVKSSF